MTLTQVITGGSSDSRLISIRRKEDPQIRATPVSKAHSGRPNGPSFDPWAAVGRGRRPVLDEGWEGTGERTVAGLTDVICRPRQAERDRGMALEQLDCSRLQPLRPPGGWSTMRRPALLRFRPTGRRARSRNGTRCRGPWRRWE